MLQQEDSYQSCITLSVAAFVQPSCIHVADLLARLHKYCVQVYVCFMLTCVTVDEMGKEVTQHSPGTSM